MKKSIAVLMVVLLALTASSCGIGRKKDAENASSAPGRGAETSSSQAEEPETPPDVPEEPGPMEAAQAAYQALKSLDMEGMARTIEGINASAALTDDTRAVAELIVQNLSCTFSEAAVDGDSATIPATIVNRDFSGVIPALIPSALMLAAQNPGMSQEELAGQLTGQLAEQLEKAGDKTVSREVGLSLVQSGGTWKVKLSKEAADALFGGLLGGVEGLAEQFGITLPGLPAVQP